MLKKYNPLNVTNMETEDIKREKAEEREALNREKAREAVEEASSEEIRNFAETRPEPQPNSFWGQSGTFWIVGICAILIVFLLIWIFFI